jgi:hypothetical protein
VLEVPFRGQHPARAVGQFDGQSPAQGPQAHRGVGDRGEAEPLPGGTVDPVAQPGAADVEGESAQQRRSWLGVFVELFEQLCRAVGGFDDDPFVGDAAELLALDHAAGQPIAHQVRTVVFGRAAAADLELHQYCGGDVFQTCAIPQHL